MKKILILVISVVLLFALLPATATANDYEVKVNTTAVYQKSVQLSHTAGGSYPVLTSTYRYRVVTNVQPQDGNSTVSETSSGFVVTFIKAGKAKLKITYHIRETYSKYNTEEQTVLDYYDKNGSDSTVTDTYTILSLADSYKVPDGYVGVFKDGYEYIDFATQDVINAKFGKNTLVRYATLKDFYGFSYTFKDNTFNVELNNFTGNGLYFRCPKKDTVIMIRLTGQNKLTGVSMAYGKESPFTAIAATGSDSILLIYAAEDGASLDVNMNVQKGKNDSSAISHYAPFCVSGGTQVCQLNSGCRPEVNVDLNVEKYAADSRKVNLATGLFEVADADVNYTYRTNGYMKNYSGVGSRLQLTGDAIFSGKLINSMTTDTMNEEYLFPKITYSNNFTGGAYFECSGGRYMNPSKVNGNEIFIPNNLLNYEAAVNGVQYHSVTASNDKLLKKVDPEDIAKAFPDILINKALPSGMTGTGFAAALSWKDENKNVPGTVESGRTYMARAVFVPVKGYYVYLRGLSSADRKKAKPMMAVSVSNVPLPNTSTTRLDALDFQLFRVESGAPSFTKQPESQYANPGDTVEFYAPYTNVTYDASAGRYKAEWHIVTKATLFGYQFSYDRVLSDSDTYSGTQSNTLKVKANNTTFKATYYCKIYGVGYEPVKSDKVRIIKYETVSALSMGINLGLGMQPHVGSETKSTYPYAFDENDKNLYYSDAVTMDKDNCFWYAGAAQKSPARMADTDKFSRGGTYTYRFTFRTKGIYLFDKDLQCDFSEHPEIKAAQILFNDNSKRTVCTVDFTFGPLTELIGDDPYELHFNEVPVPYEGVPFADTAVPYQYARYDLINCTGWHPYTASTSEVTPSIGNLYYMKMTIRAHDGYGFYGSKSDTVTTLYDTDGSAYHAETYDYKVYGENNGYMDIIIGMKCTQRRAKTLTLLNVNGPSEGDPPDRTGTVDPKGISLVSLTYTDDMGDLLSENYVCDKDDTITVAVKVAASEDVKFEKDLEMTWNVLGTTLATTPSTDSSLKDNERLFEFTLPVHQHEWVKAENVTYLVSTATCTTGTTYYESCFYCGKQGTKTFELDDKQPHALVKTDAKAATCTAKGNVEYYTCFDCHKIFSDAAGAKEITQAATVVKKLGHDLKKTAAKAAGCTQKGNIEYYTCARCGKLFSDAAGTKAITQADTVVKKLGHDLKKTAAKAAGCTFDGNIEYYACARCGKLFSDAAGTKEIAQADAVVEKLGHDLHKTAAKAAGCTSDGNIEYYTCARCGKLFSDAAGTQEITDVAVKKTGHDFGGWIVTKAATEDEEGVETRTCTKCGQEQTRAIAKIGTEFMLGDVDGDKKITSADARLALRRSVGLEDYPEGSAEFSACDVDFDGKVSAADARLILRASVGLEDPATWVKP